MELSKHFIRRWKERVETPIPSLEEIEQIISESMIAQHFKVFTLYNRATVKKLAIYVHPDRKLILKIDELDNKIVTVISEQCINREKAKLGKVQKSSKLKAQG